MLGSTIDGLSTTVEIILYYLTSVLCCTEPLSTTVEIILYYLTWTVEPVAGAIYNSRNYSILLNLKRGRKHEKSTTVEIILYYLTLYVANYQAESTTVEIILYDLTCTVEPTAGVIYNSRNYSILLNAYMISGMNEIYNSRNYSILLNPYQNMETVKSTTVEIILYYLTSKVWTPKHYLQQ